MYSRDNLFGNGATHSHVGDLDRRHRSHQGRRLSTHWNSVNEVERLEVEGVDRLSLSMCYCG